MGKETMAHDHCCEHGCCGRRSPSWRLIRVMIGALIILVVLALGVAAGRKSEWRRMDGRSVFPDKQMMGLAQGDNIMFFRNMQPGAGSMMDGKLKDAKRVAGVVAGVESGKITVTDNGGAQQVIYTTGDTVVTGQSGAEMPVANLKAKQFIVSWVTVKDGKSTAQFIQVVQ